MLIIKIMRAGGRSHRWCQQSRKIFWSGVFFQLPATYLQKRRWHGGKARHKLKMAVLKRLRRNFTNVFNSYAIIHNFIAFVLSCFFHNWLNWQPRTCTHLLPSSWATDVSEATDREEKCLFAVSVNQLPPSCFAHKPHKLSTELMRQKYLTRRLEESVVLWRVFAGAWSKLLRSSSNIMHMLNSLYIQLRFLPYSYCKSEIIMPVVLES